MDLTTALARLLTNRDLRAAYSRDPQSVAKNLGVDETVLRPFLALDPVALESQAELLLNKRFFEIRGLLPETCSQFGEDARKQFREHAERVWPEGHRRHVLDALSFCKYLKDEVNFHANQCEVNRLQFILAKRRLAIHLVRDLVVHGRPRRGIQFLLRDRDGLPHQFAFYLNV